VTATTKLINFKMKDTQHHKQLANFVINENLFAFLDGLDCHEENFIIDCHKFRVAQFSSIRVCKPSYKMIPQKELHAVRGIWP